MNQAAHVSLSGRRLADQMAAETASAQEPPHDGVWRDDGHDDGIETGFDADALSAMKPSMPATGSAATLPRSADDPVAGCALQRADGQSGAPVPKAVVIDALRAAIDKIEGHAQLEGGTEGESHSQTLEAWRLGCPAFDGVLPLGLDTGAVHEVKAGPHPQGASAGDWMAGLGFALRLAVRRAMMVAHSQQTQAQPIQAQPIHAQPWLLWCWPRALSAEFGSPSALGLAALGLDPSRLIIVETARAADALVALEDGLKSSSLALAFGIFDCVALTPARRLSLAAAHARTPCLLITHPASEVSGATATRWRVERQPSGLHVFDPRAPGNARYRVSLERARAQTSCAQNASAQTQVPGLQRSRSQKSLLPEVLGRPFSLEWCDETRTFSMASGVAGHAAGARRARGGSQ